MSSIQLAIAAIPVATYLLLIGALRLRKSAFVTTGWRDTFTLGLALTGLVMIGPLQLFFPYGAASRLHGYVWIALVSLYMLSLVLIVLSRKASLIAYGMDGKQFRETLLLSAQKEDESSYWTGNVLTLPNAGIQLAMEASKSETVHQVTHVGMLQNIHAWIRLERNFVKGAAAVESPRTNTGWLYVAGACALLIYAVAPLVANPDVAYAQLVEFINR